MTVYYCDSSALVKRHVNESGSHWFSALVDDQSVALFTTQISAVEVCSALNRRLRESHFSVVDYRRLIAQAEYLFDAKYEVIALSVEIVGLACSILERRPLRAFDAVHLATALIVKERLHARNEPAPTFLATDQRLLTAAAAEGLPTFDPTGVP